MSEKYLGENLIFIISMPRSGSTLLQRVLGGHADIATSSEPWIMLHPVYGRRDQGISTEYSADWAALGVNEFLEHYTDGPEVYDDGIRAFAKTIYANAMHKGGGMYFLDKTPRYVLIIDDLIRLFPAARFVFLLRNPLSVLSSIVNSQVSHDLWTLERFADELLKGPQAILNGIEQLGDDAIVVRYEDFVRAPEKHLQLLCDRLEIAYTPGLLEYDNSVTEGFMQDRTGIQKHSRPEKSRSDSWQDLLTSAQKIHFADSYLHALGRSTVAAFGYPYDDFMAAITAAANSDHERGHVFPWSVATKHPAQLRGRDQLDISLYRNIRDLGPLRGRLKTLAKFLRSLWRSVKFVFSRG